MQRRSRSLIALFSIPIAAGLVFGVGAATRSNTPSTSALSLEASLGNRTLTVKKFGDRKSTRLNSSHVSISYAVFCLKKKKIPRPDPLPDAGRPSHGALIQESLGP